ncbi:MAG: transglutaminase-like domain-containing protein [Pirellulaceae bacterium]
MLKPTACRPEAFQFFAEQLPTIEKTESLLMASVAISMHALDDVNPESIKLRVLALGARVAQRLHSDSVDAALAHLHHTLFEEEGFQGNDNHYYQPLNSYLPAVLELRRGLPITLALVYKAVGEQVGLRIEGVNAPFHFLAQVATPNNWLLVDPFFRGSVLTRDEAFDRIEKVSGQRIARNRASLRKASHAEWLMRILANLQNVFAAHDRVDDLAAMNEFQQLLEEELF